MTDTLASLSKALGAKYEVKRLVGSGGFAEVYEVWDKDLERRLAVKVLRPDVAWTSGMIERFQRETRAAARLEHPNILPIHFVGDGEGLVYYAMPFVDGMSLGELLKRSGALPPDRALAIIIPILDALDHAHKAGLIHRDIKPDNIMLDTARGRPLLVDFGIARRLDSEAGAGLTQTGLVIGTPHYMSPEQALGDPNLGPRSDLYSLGCVLFQMVTGSPPFDGESSQQVAVEVGGEELRILPGGSVNWKVDRASRLDVSWQLISRLGVSLGDTIGIARPRGTVRIAATARPTHGSYFAPLITNETGRPLTITVNAGLAGSMRCGCVVPPGAVRMAIGYYPLFENSTVRAEADGRAATFKDLGPQVDATRGIVGLLFKEADLRTTH